MKSTLCIKYAVSWKYFCMCGSCDVEIFYTFFILGNTPRYPRSPKHTKQIYRLNLPTPAPTYVRERGKRKREAKVRFNRVKFSPSP